MIEVSGSIPLTSGSGSGRHKNMWILWIRIRIRIRNTGCLSVKIWHNSFIRGPLILAVLGDLWHFGAGPDPTPFFWDLKDAKKNSYSFSIAYPQAHYLLFGKFNLLLKFYVKTLFCKHYFSLLYEKREGYGSVPLNNGSGSGRPLYMQIRIPNTGF